MSNAVIYDAIRDWLHESPLNLCTTGSDTCDNSELAEALTNLVAAAGTKRERACLDKAIAESNRYAELLEARRVFQGPPKRKRWWQL